MISRMDRDVGRIMKLLKELDIDRNTIVFFTSDNGHQDGHGLAPDFFDASGGLRGHKINLYEGGIRVPMIVRWPGRIKPDTTSEQIWAFWDFMPTAADLAGVRPPDGIDGVSVLPTLTGHEQTDLADRPLYWELGVSQAARIGKWKAIRSNPNAALELYNLDSDPSERNNVAAEHPKLIAKFKRFLATARIASPQWPSELDNLDKQN
jgi:arylsulfatase A-like enzyme